MSDFAVVKVAGKQHLVSVGDEIDVNANFGQVGDKVSLDEVLLCSLGDKISIGTPLVSGVKVGTEVVFNGKGEKIRVAKFKSKVRYRKVIGFRPLLTTIKVLSLGESKAKEEVKTVKKASKKKS